MNLPVITVIQIKVTDITGHQLYLEHKPFPAGTFSETINIPALVKDYVINEKIVLRDMPKKNYELWIVPEKVGTFTVRFADSAPGEPYKQKITG